jgi:hypothetical protein
MTLSATKITANTITALTLLFISSSNGVSIEFANALHKERFLQTQNTLDRWLLFFLISRTCKKLPFEAAKIGWGAAFLPRYGMGRGTKEKEQKDLRFRACAALAPGPRVCISPFKDRTYWCLEFTLVASLGGCLANIGPFRLGTCGLMCSQGYH